MIISTQKILIIRFSSLGDITQALSIPAKLKGLAPEIHWVTRHDMAVLIEGNSTVSRVWSLDRKQGFLGLFRLSLQLKKQKYSHIYDAHNNLRSHFLCWMLSPPLALSRLWNAPLIVRKSQRRWKRFLLFRFRINKFKMPFSGQRDLLEPLEKWGLDSQLPPTPVLQLQTDELNKVSRLLLQKGFENFVALAPSAAHLLKRWPVEHWRQLIQLAPAEKFVLLGGKEDLFLKDLAQEFPGRVLNLAGELSLRESACVVKLSKTLVANDTGPLHFGEQLGHPTVALMGPAPFGFPSRPKTRILQLDLACRPCSKHGQGPCRNPEFHKCLRDISPAQVWQSVQANQT